MKIKNKDLDQLIVDMQSLVTHINYMQEALNALEQRINYFEFKLIEAKQKERKNER